MKNASTILSAAAVLLTAGCAATGPNYEPPATASPAAFKHASDVAAPTPASNAWWDSFHDPVLAGLVSDGLAHNPQLASAVARLDEARARLGFARAGTLPDVAVNANARLVGESAERTAPSPLGPITYRDRGDTYRVPFDAAYEIDLWGRVRRQVEAAGAQAEASEHENAFIRLTLSAEVAQAYFAVRSLNSEAAVLQRGIALRRDQLSLSQSRFDAGFVSALDISRSEIELAAAEADYVDVMRRRDLAANALAILTGRSPAEFEAPTDSQTLPAPPAIPAGLPSALLQRRPDVVAAERLLAARTAEIGVAKAAFFPTIRLTGSAGFESADLGSLLGRPSQFWQLGPTISYALFDGGRKQANLEVAEARVRGALADYQQKVLVAFREVEDALVDLRRQAEQAQSQERVRVAAQDALGLSTARYEKGLVNYLEVIDAQRSLLSAERALVQLNSARQLSTVRLIKALGGGWNSP